jgi:hypothetical protein
MNDLEPEEDAIMELLPIPDFIERGALALAPPDPEILVSSSINDIIIVSFIVSA